MTPDTPASITCNLRNLPVNEPLRTEWQYNNMMYTVASYLVERLSDQSFESYLQNRIWKPLDMHQTYLGIAKVPEHEKTKVARGYQSTALGDKFANLSLWENAKFRLLPWLDQPEAQGAGIIISNVKDMGRWVRCMLNRASPLPESAHSELSE